MAAKRDLVEKSICLKCSIVFPTAAECPRCGKKDNVNVYFDICE